MTDLAQTFHDLVRVETVLWNAVDARLQAECELTLARYEVMQVIRRSACCRVGDIAGELAIGWSGASKIVDRVEAAGHCRRRADPGDARSSRITLTPRGGTLLSTATLVVSDELRQRLAAVLDPAALDALGQALARLRTS